MIGKKAYSYKAVPGTLDLGNENKVEIEIEVWTHRINGRPFVAECSYTLDKSDYYKIGDTIKNGEKFLKLMGKEASDLVFRNFEKFNGLKVRALFTLQVK